MVEWMRCAKAQSKSSAGPGPFSLGLPEEIKRDPGNLNFLSNDLRELCVL